MAMPKFFTHALLEKGWRYAYNYLYFLVTYNTRRPWLIKLLQWIEPYPTYIEVETTTACNLSCVMCERTYWDQKTQSLSFDAFRDLIDQFPHLKWIGVTGIGESYLNKDFRKMLRYCKEERNLIVEMYDVFYFIDEECAEELVDLGVDQLFVSLDAATPETYEKIRVGSDFGRVITNVKRFLQIRAERGNYFPVLDFHFIVSKENSHEILPYIEMVAEMAPGSKIQFTRLLHSYPEIEPFFVNIPAETIAAAHARAAELGVAMHWNQNASLAKPPMTECATWFMPFIFVTGEVIPCCSGNEANQRERQRRESLGNVFEKPFADIWWGVRYRDLRKKLRSGETPDPCSDCCLYEKKTGCRP